MFFKKKEKSEAEVPKTQDITKTIMAIRINRVVTAVIMILLGLVHIIWPETSLLVMCKIGGALLALTGLAAIVIYLFNRDKSLVLLLSLIGGTIVGIMGLWLFINPNYLISLFPSILGVIIFISGIVDIMDSFSIFRRRRQSSVLSLVLGIITTALGILIFMNPFKTVIVIIRVIGAVLIFDGITNLIVFAHVAGKFDRFMKKKLPVAAEGEFVEEEPSEKPAWKEAPADHEDTADRTDPEEIPAAHAADTVKDTAGGVQESAASYAEAVQETAEETAEDAAAAFDTAAGAAEEAAGSAAQTPDTAAQQAEDAVYEIADAVDDDEFVYDTGAEEPAKTAEDPAEN